MSRGHAGCAHAPAVVAPFTDDLEAHGGCAENARAVCIDTGEKIQGQVSIPSQVGPQGVEPGAALPVSRGESRNAEGIAGAHSKGIVDPAQCPALPRVRIDKRGKPETGNIEGLARRDRRDDQGGVTRQGCQGIMARAGLAKVMVNLVRQDHQSVSAGDLQEGGQFILAPYPAHGVVGRAQEQQARPRPRTTFQMLQVEAELACLPHQGCSTNCRPLSRTTAKNGA